MRLFRILVARERGFLIGWAVGILLYFFIIGWSYATVKDHAAGLERLWESLPKSLREAFGNAPSITTPGGYFQARGTSFLPLILGGALAAHGTRWLSGAEQAGELDLVLNLPIRRSMYFWSHYASGLVMALSWLAAAALGAVAGMALAGMDADVLGRIAFMVLETLPFLLAAHAGATWAGAGLHRRSPGTAIIASALGTAFLLQIVSALTASVAWLSWLSPYARWTHGDAFHFRSDPAYLAWCIVLVGVSLPLARLAWLRKDLKG